MEQQLKEVLVAETLRKGAIQEVVYRTGAAQVIKEPNVIRLAGDIESVSGFLKKRYEETSGDEPALRLGKGAQYVDFEKAVVLSDIDNGTITLLLDPENFYGASVTAQLLPSKELEIFNINEPQELSREDLIKLFRFNKIHFADPIECDQLVKALQKFSAKAYVDLMKEDDHRGNVTAAVNKRVETGIPTGFALQIPIYKGQPALRIPVDICLDVVGTRTVFWFESVTLAEKLEETKREIFQKELEACKDFPIIHK